MKLYKNKKLSVLTFLLIPILSFWNPSWVALLGYQPYWPIFWLLPWGIRYGSINTAFMGLILGLILDSINNDVYTQIPGLVCCGFWFGKFSDLNRINFARLKFGLIACLGSLICGLILLIQIIFNVLIKKQGIWSNSYVIQIISAQVFLTGIYAPVFCSWLFYVFKKED